jgi:hypothetical protein
VARDTQSGRRGGLTALDKLERALDRTLWREAERLWQVATDARVGRRRARDKGSPAGPSKDPESPDPGRFVRGLERALSLGAYDAARELSARLTPGLVDLAEPMRSRATELVVSALLLGGESEQAATLARSQLGRLQVTARGATLLEALGLREPVWWLPDGRPNMLAISREIEQRGTSAEELAHSLRFSPSRWLRTPELPLLFFSALVTSEPQRALRFLNRFLRRRGLVPGTLYEREGNVLGALRFEQNATATGGPLVSVLLAARNAEATIGFAIDSLLGQTHANLEILACDDASDDATFAILQGRYGKNPRVRVFRSLENQGPYNIRNALYQSARGELITFHDADDLALPERIAAQVRRMRQRSVAACVTNILRMTASGSIVFSRDQRAVRLGLVSLMLTRAAFERFGPFRSARMGADLELYEDLKSALSPQQLSRIEAPLIFCLSSPGSLTQSPGSESHSDGYRSPARRAYSELIHRKQALNEGLSAAEIEAILRASGNYVEPKPVAETQA